MRHIIIALLAVFVGGIGLTACGSNADTVSKNISQEAEKFRVGRRIVVTNNITDKTLYEVVGRCSFERPDSDTLDVVCKNNAHDYTKASFFLGDNVTAASVQLGPINVSEYRTKIILRPTAVIPDLDLVTGNQNP